VCRAAKEVGGRHPAAQLQRTRRSRVGAGVARNPERATLIPSEKRRMKLQHDGDTLRICAVKELSATNANSFRDETRHAFSDGQRHIEIDLSETTAVDSCGLGALVALHRTTSGRGGALRLVNPTPAVQQILELTRMHRIFEVIRD